MKFNIFKNIRLEYRALYGENSKKYYVLSEKFWNFIQKQLTEERFKTKRDLAGYIAKITNNKISQRAIESWLYRNRKPIIVKNFEAMKFTGKGCKHGFTYFCPLCNLNQGHTENSPAPLFWITHPKGRLYVYKKYWEELKYHIDNTHKYGLLLSNLYPKINIDTRVIRNWKINRGLPEIYNDDEFSFSKYNLYFLGLFLSDGHLRNNGSTFSFAYQVGSSNIFQGYWYPQFIQRMLPIFKHKKTISNTYITVDRTYSKPAFRTNLSSISPIFIKKLIKYELIQKRNKASTSGYLKKIPENFLKELDSYHEYFQGVFDGDGTYSFSPSPIIDLSTTPDINYSMIIDIMSLIPTLTTHDKKTFISYSKRKNNSLYMIRFAPGSLNRLPEKYNSQQIVEQLDFFLEAAQHSIRPDKVYKLINIIKTITSKQYGEYNNCHPLQKEIRDLAIKANFQTKIRLLKRQYPIKNNKYQPFMPKWAEHLCSKDEAWDFFFKKENLVFKDKNNKLTDVDFAEGIHIHFEF